MGPIEGDAAANLVRRIASEQDRSAFEVLFSEFAPRVRALLLRQGCDSASADEIAQEALLMVWRKAALFSPERGSVAAWIFTIARNLRIDRLRREVVWQDVSDDHSEQPDDAPLQDQTIDSARIVVRMRGVLARLPQEQVDVVTLAYIEGLSHGEIADRLGLPLGTVKSRMRLAYQKIRLAFEDME